MSQNVAPWLQGLEEAWEVPEAFKVPQQISFASHDASSLDNGSLSRIAQRNITGLLSSTLSRQGSSQGSTQRRRNPLATISHNDSNTLRRQNGTTKLAGTRSFSGASEGSVMQYGTVQQRAKSTSPTKKQETLEWKRRLVKGQLGYGDQTDLFGPSGLENIFAQTGAAEPSARKTRSSMNWLDRSAVPPMPSSPPPWPAKEDADLSDGAEEEGPENDGLTTVDEERESYIAARIEGNDGSLRSNPFNPANSFEDGSGLPSELRDELEVYEGLPADRTVSGQTELEQEDFSPVFISKHTTLTGQVDYKALDSRMIRQFQDMHVSLRHPSQQNQELDTASTEDSVGMDVEESRFTDGPQSDSLPAVPDLSLSENLPTGTPPVTALGRNVELKRGGYSNYGSFKQRPLSPSQSAAEEYIDYDPSSLISPLPSTGSRLPAAPTPPVAPSTPLGLRPFEPKSKSSGSPLKLFGPHDTFTNNRLLRRMSQLDPEVAALRSEIDEGMTKGASGNRQDQRAMRKISRTSFGSGEHDAFVFDAEITVTSASDLEKVDSDQSPGSEIPPPGSRMPAGFRADSSPETKDTFRIKRKASRQSATTSKASTLEAAPSRGGPRTPAMEDVSRQQSRPGVEASSRIPSVNVGKRPPNSPYKAPLSKRRRTLYSFELPESGAETQHSFDELPKSPASSRKRKDARKGEDQNTAEADVLAQRKMLRPRNPTPSQRRKEAIEAEIREATEDFAAQEPGKLEAVMEQIEESMASDSPPSLQQQARAVANEVAKFTLRVQKASGEYTERKRSVTTQDFFNEAVMVMKLIREKAGRQSVLGSVAESDQEASRGSSHSGMSEYDNSALRVSRPPSREGGSGWRPRTSQQTDARKISHLRRFQENDDTEFIAPSIASLGVVDQDEPQMVVLDEASNVRITGPLNAEVRLAHEGIDSGPASQRSEMSTLHSQSTHKSDGTSTGKTMHTSSTRKSDNLGTLAPDAVAHLIGEQVGGMTFDKEKQQWIRMKGSPAKEQYPTFLEPSQISSDDDPFREISDLPVDERKEEEIRKTSSGHPSATQSADPTISVPEQGESRTTSQETVITHPANSESRKPHHAHSSSIPSTRYTGLHSSQQQHIDTRATSWSNAELQLLSAQGKANQQPLAYAAAQAAIALADRHGIVELTHQGMNLGNRAVLDQRFSEDVITTDRDFLVDEVSQEETESLHDLRDDTAISMDIPDIEEIASPKLRQTPQRAIQRPSSIYRQPTRQVSLRRKTLTREFKPAEVREQSELSFVAALPGERVMSVSLSVSRPASSRYQQGHVTDPQSSPSKFDPSFVLSDLPDFTVHGEDLERPSERTLAQRLAKHAAAEANDRYALAVKDLVKTLTDVQADDPYWDDLKQLDLHDRSLVSLHGLNDFCGKVQEMDVSGNALTHLGGAPATIRNLFARSNQLSNLTAWTHLMNLQYLDISGNQLDNLDALGCLIHLRELRVDDNQITNLDGVQQLDGLLKLRLRRNKLRSVDFQRSQLYRLQELDLAENEIGVVKHLESLQALQTLKLDGNVLQGLLHVEEEMAFLQHLSVQRCKLQRLSVSAFPSLRTLLADDNLLSTIDSIEKCKALDILSMRRQAVPTDKTLSILDEAVEARTIRLSGNRIPSLELQHGFLGLQHLELASVGLLTLPDDFGLRCPNLKSLNLDFNSLKDLRPLLNIQSLDKLSVCGNRLDRLRKSIATLSMMKRLSHLDLRDNPLTQGCYASNTSTAAASHTSVIRRARCSRDDADEDEDQKRETGEVARYSLPLDDVELDRLHHEKLDEATKLRRRVYELLLANSCAELRSLDGLVFRKKEATRKDQVWERLVALGVVRKSSTVGGDEVRESRG